MRIPRRMLPHLVIVQAYAGQGAHGPVYAPPETIRAAVEDTVRLVRRPNGAETVSSTTVRVDPHHHIPAESLVTTWPGTEWERVAEVITVSRWQYPGTPSHLELALT